MSLTHADIRLIRSLGSKKFRDETGLFVVEGEKLVAEALASRFRVERVIRREEVGEEVMGKISQLSSPPPVLALVRKEAEGESVPEQGLILALDGIRDPGNLGTILRIADWFAVTAVVASPDSAERYNPKVVQATMGAIFRVPYYTRALPEFLQGMQAKGSAVCGTFVDGDTIYNQEFPKGDAATVVVIGNEANGISAAVEACCGKRLSIPRYGHGESLNAAVATALVVAEIRRRG